MSYGILNQPVRMFAGPAERDKFNAEVVAGMVLNGSPDLRPGTVMRDRLTGAETPLVRPNSGPRKDLAVAKVLLMDAGVAPSAVDSLANDELGRILFGDPNVGRMRGISAAAIGNVSGQYQNLLYDAANVSLRIGYDEVRPTFKAWATRSEDVPDFRDNHLVNVGAFPDPTAIGEDGEIDEIGTVDERATMRVVEWGSKIGLSYKLATNDRLGGLVTARARKFGAAMSRKQNRLVYSLLKDNAALPDGYALFDDTNHGNKTTGSVSDYGAAFNTMIKKLAAQKAPGAGSSPLGLKAGFCLYPPAIDQSIKELLRSTTSLTATNSGVVNVYEGIVEPIQEAELGAAFGGSDTAFYLAHNGSQTETVLYAYLAGQGDGPVIREYEIPGTLNRVMVCHQGFGCIAFHRGLQLHTGA